MMLFSYDDSEACCIQKYISWKEECVVLTQCLCRF